MDMDAAYGLPAPAPPEQPAPPPLPPQFLRRQSLAEQNPAEPPTEPFLAAGEDGGQNAFVAVGTSYEAAPPAPWHAAPAPRGRLLLLRLEAPEDSSEPAGAPRPELSISNLCGAGAVRPAAAAAAGGGK